MFEFIMEFIVIPIGDYFFTYRDSVDPRQGVSNWVTSILLSLGMLFCVVVTALCIGAKWWLPAIASGAGLIWFLIKYWGHFSECLKNRR